MLFFFTFIFFCCLFGGFFFSFFSPKTCSPSCPGTHYIDQSGLELRDALDSASQVIGSKVWATTAQQSLYLKFHFILFNFTNSQSYLNDSLTMLLIAPVVPFQNQKDHILASLFSIYRLPLFQTAPAQDLPCQDTHCNC